MTYIRTNIQEVDADFSFIFVNKFLVNFLTRNIYNLSCYVALKKELKQSFPNLSLLDFDIIVWLLFLLKNNKLHLLFLAIYFKPPESKLEFNLSSFSKIRKGS